MPAATELVRDAPSERRRRALLAASDRLLDRVEELRLADHVETPPSLQGAIRALEQSLGRAERARHLPTLQAAHDLVFAVQERLLAVNRGRPTPRGHPGRAPGTPIVTRLEGMQQWKLLALPPRPDEPEADPVWRELVHATLERALDRWAWAQHHAGAAARRGEGAGRALRIAEHAWRNYWEMRCEAERVGVVR